jgi:hypothetical protein
MDKTQARCRALKRDQTPCPNPAKYGGYCGVHFPKKKAEWVERASAAAKYASGILTLAVGAEEVVNLAVKFWQALPFGPGPRMPEEYKFLTARIPVSYPEMLDGWSPTTKGPNSIDWAQAKKLYLHAKALQEQIQQGAPESAVEMSARQLDAEISLFIDSVQPGLKGRLVGFIAAKAEKESTGNTE